MVPDFAYEDALREIVAHVVPAEVKLSDAAALIRCDLEALQVSVAGQPRDNGVIRDRAVILATDALRVLDASGEAGELPGVYVRPTAGRLPAMIAELVPLQGDAWLLQDDPVARWADEVSLAVSGYLDPAPGSLEAAPIAKMRALLRIVAVVARGIVRERPVSSIRPGGDSA